MAGHYANVIGIVPHKGENGVNKLESVRVWSHDKVLKFSEMNVVTPVHLVPGVVFFTGIPNAASGECEIHACSDITQDDRQSPELWYYSCRTDGAAVPWDIRGAVK